MKRRLGRLFLTLLITGLIVAGTIPSAKAQDQSVGLFLYDSLAFEGYTMFYPFASTSTYLIDMWGRTVHEWPSDKQSRGGAYMLDDGSLLRMAQDTTSGLGYIQRIAWDGTLMWDFLYDDSTVTRHHDIEYLPNGNVLILAWEVYSDSAAFEAGRDPALLQEPQLWPEQIVEVQPTGLTTGDIVWEWHLWDHVIQDFDSTKDNYGVVEDHPELVDINYAPNPVADWIHANAIDYNAEYDQIVMSSRVFSEIWIIDHSTTTAEAAGHAGGNQGKGGDLLYRWGNPQTYRRGDSTDQILDKQHNSHWIADGLQGAGNMLIFNNGTDRGWSAIEEIVTPVDISGAYPELGPGEAWGPEAVHWTYPEGPDSSFYAQFISGTQRLPNGNTFICDGPSGHLFEVTSDGQKVWEYFSPIGFQGIVYQGNYPIGAGTFRALRFSPDHPAFVGRSLIPGTAIEQYDITLAGTSHSPPDPTLFDSIYVTSAVASDTDLVNVELYFDTGQGFLPTTMYDDGAHGDSAAGDGIYGAVLPPISAGTLVRYYVHTLDVAARVVSDPINKPTTTYWLRPTGFECADIDGSGDGPNIGDLTYLVDFLFRSGPVPEPWENGNFNGTGDIDITDLTHLIDFLFRDGPPPACVT